MGMPLSVLILEDSSSDAELMLHALRQAGYDPIAFRAETEQEYRERLESAPEIILADFSMPEFDPLFALQIMQESQLDIPFIVVSGTIGEERAVQVMQCGATDYVFKDRLGRLGQAVGKALEQKRLLKAKRAAEQALRHSEELSRKVLEAQQWEHEARKIAEENNRVKDQFLATLSHELRTPLMPMLGWCQMLLDGGEDEQTRIKGLRVIERNVKIQARLIEDILNVSQIISGKLLLNIVAVDLICLIEAAIEVVRPAADNKKIKIVCAFPQVPVMIAGDPHRLQQVVWNLLVNAVKYSVDGGTILVSVCSMAAHVEIVVQDSGIGISAAFLPFVFDRFKQADSGYTREYGGLGIGLSLVKDITELHGGTVRAESGGEGRGSSFTVNLPISKEINLGVSPDILPDPLSSPHGILHNLTLLIVDDELDARDLLYYSLSVYGAQVTTAGSVREALACYLKEKPDVLISDLGMPFDDGFTLIKEIRALEVKSGVYTPAIALSAFAADDDRHRSLAAGFQIHIAKPIEPVQLMSIISKLLKDIQIDSRAVR